MITKSELIEYAKKKSLNLGQAETDYFQNIILFIIYSKSNLKIIFKGGTALQKCFGLERFSEDLDFNASGVEDLKGIINQGLKEFFIEFEVEFVNHPKGKNFIYRIKGPLYNKNRNSLCKIQIDLSFREETKMKPKIIKIAKMINEIPSFNVLVMDTEEIFAEKIRAILTRDKARDIYDISFLLDQKTKQNNELINKKLAYDKIIFSKEKLFKKINSNKKLWEMEMKPLLSLSNYIEFKDVLNNIKSKLK